MKAFFGKSRFRGSADYWERRYAKGGNSGVGSYGVLARYKAEVVNAFVRQKDIRSAIEFGCGDSHQASYYEIPRYVGIDVSETAIAACRDRFKEDPTRGFFTHRDFQARRDAFVAAVLTLSLDVIYHLVENRVFEEHVRDLFRYASRYVIIYSTNFDQAYENPHQVDRHFTPYIEKHIRVFRLIETILNPHKGDATMSDFYIYERVGGS